MSDNPIWDDRATELLGTARRRTRPRGFAPWKPKDDAQRLLAQIGAVLTEYAPYLPLTCRQIFYRLVGAHGFAKTNNAYENLCNVLNRARRARLISMDAIRDDGGVTEGGTGWASTDDFLTSVRDQHEAMSKSDGSSVASC